MLRYTCIYCLVIYFCILFTYKFTITLFIYRISQILVCNGSSPIAVLVQFRERILLSLVGSKTENRFLTISSLFYVM